MTTDNVKLDKRSLAKLKPGTWLLISWLDSDPTPALLLEKIDGRQRGDVSIKAYYPHNGDVDSHAVHDQVIAVLGACHVPQVPEQFEKTRFIP